MPEQPFNPLDKSRLGESVARAFLVRSVVVLPPEPFDGAGIYALYYTGDFPAYRRIAERNRNGQWEAPIYVGKAVPPGTRKGGHGLDEPPGRVLYNRLRNHAKSIQQVENLSLNDFKCRCLVVDDVWITLGESLLIATFSPLWNQLLEGFGNNPQGSGRSNQERSVWDQLHPGRPGAAKLKPNSRSPDEILKSIADFLK